jgi:hypothetical protein
MSVEEAVVEKLRSLPEEKKREVLHFVESLAASRPRRPKKSLHGLLAHLQVDLSLEDFREVRREMSESFPRDIS